MDFGVTDTGFVLKSFLDIMKDIEKRYKVRLQDNEYTLDFNTPEGIHSEAIGFELSKLWEELLDFNNQMNLNTATGIDLDFVKNSTKSRGLCNWASKDNRREK